jgi:hypothetical protein
MIPQNGRETTKYVDETLLVQKRSQQQQFPTLLIDFGREIMTGT